MGSHLFEILRQGIWASLTGGWFYDPHLSIFINTFHLYLWMFLLTFPLILHLILPPKFFIWAIYCVIIGVVFVLITIVNNKLHHIFDTSEVIEEVDNKNSKKEDSSVAIELGSHKTSEVFEMIAMSSSSKLTQPSESRQTDLQSDTTADGIKTPGPDSGVKEWHSKQKDPFFILSIEPDHQDTGRAPLAEMDSDDIDLSVIVSNGDTTKVITHCHSETDKDDVDTPTDEEDKSAPNTITTKADVEIEPSKVHIGLHDDCLYNTRIKLPLEANHSRDVDFSDDSPEHSYVKMKKPKHKVERTKSALESSNLPSKYSSEHTLRPHPSLPCRPKLDSIINKDTGVTIIRPWSDQTICRTKQMLESDEITVIDFEVMNNVAKAFYTRNAAKQEITQLPKTLNEDSDHSEAKSDHEFQRLENEKHSIDSHNRYICCKHTDPNVENKQYFSQTSQQIIEEQTVFPTDELEHVNKDNVPLDSDIKMTGTKPTSNSDNSCNKTFDLNVDTTQPSKPERRKAFSEDRCVIVNQESQRTSSQPVIKVGISMFPSSSEDDSDISLGEVVVPPDNKTGLRYSISNRERQRTTIKPDVRSCQSDRKPRPNSVEFIKTNRSGFKDVPIKNKSHISSSPTLTATDSQGHANCSAVDKPKNSGFAQVTTARTASDRKGSGVIIPSVSSVANSQQSSVLGLDWLFSTDSDSSDSRSLQECDAESITSSTVSIDDSFYEGNIDIPVFYSTPQSHKRLTSTASTDTDNLDIGTEQKREPSDTKVKSELVRKDSGARCPSPGELETMRKHGAIPKHFNRPLMTLPEPVPTKEDIPDTNESSPASFDLSDPEEFHRTLIEILNEPSETHAEQLKKFMAVLEAKKHKSSSVKSKSEKEDKSVSAGESHLLGVTQLEDDMDNKSNESKPVTPTEISSLLSDHKEFKTIRPSRKPVRRKHLRRFEEPQTLNRSVDVNSHLAETHEDTSDGATHVFQDEDGNWYSYTFGKDVAGVAMSMENTVNDAQKVRTKDRWSSSSCASSAMVDVDSYKDDKASSSMHIIDDHLNRRHSDNRQTSREIIQAYVERVMESGRRSDSCTDSDSKDLSCRNTPPTKHFYMLKLLPNKSIKVYFDRLALLALLDRHLSVIGNVVALMMAVLVGAMGALVLCNQFYVDFCILLFCFIMAGCQYSLVKSVQPDAASPMHGYNHLIVFSRPLYFCLCCGLMLLLDHFSREPTTHTVYVYNMPFTKGYMLRFARDFLKVFLLCLPVVFTIGLLPQVNTFFMFTLEQIDTHIFGGNATISLLSSMYCVCRSVLASGFLYVISYLTLIQLGKTNVDGPDPCKNLKFAQTAAFSIFCALLVAMSYHLSRSTSDPSILWMLIKDKLCKKNENKENEGTEDGEMKDPLPGKMKQCLSERLQSDLLISIVIMILSFAIHVSTVFIQSHMDEVLYFTVAGFGFLIHYLIPQLRKEMPWLCCSHPILKSEERHMFEATGPAKIMWFEKVYMWTRFLERNGMYPVVILCAVTRSVPSIICKFGNYFGPLVLTVCSLKLLRFCFSNTPKQHMILAFTVLFFKYDMRLATETMLIDYFFVAIFFSKFCDLYLKMKFVMTYIAPWQITWGSAFHAFAQPFSVPHSAMLFLQAGVSAFFSTPLNPFLGSSIFITSYVRPVKFWEKDYNTKRVDHSNTRLSQQLERNTGADDNNLNSIFYEHLTRSLQHSLCGDLLMGRWGNSEQGDIFIMASDSLNALVHIIEMGNGLVTFQLRGLEFRGTYCQQREVEAITESVKDNEGFCCFEPGHLPHFLSLNSAFSQRWLSWEVVVTKYVLEGYSISDNNAASMVGVFDFRKILIMYYVQSIIYYTVRSPRLEQWLQDPTIMEALATVADENYVDVDPIFSVHVDDDYDSQNSGISHKSFCNHYLAWIQYCTSRSEKPVDSKKDSPLVSLCFALSLLGRRALGTASHNNASASVEFFLYGLHALFKGDFRITSSRDEWVFADMELLRRVVAPGVRMSLKLHQDHFLISDAYETEELLYDAISHYETNLVISHEADPSWRNAVLSNTPSLLALRNVFDEGSDEYKIIMLNKRFLTFRIVKVNRECVRGLWAGQQQELIFFRNRNPERGSIQNAKQALRNMINSSCDQPIGYPIYVSPLTTSYSSTNEQYTSVIGGEFIIANVKRFFKNAWQSLRRHCGVSCTSGGSAFVEGEIPYSCTHQSAASVLGTSVRSCPPITATTAVTISGDIALNTRGNRGSLISTTSSATSKPRSMVTLVGLITENQQIKETSTNPRVKIVDTSCVFDNINLGRRIDVQWPNEEWRNNGGRNAWVDWSPAANMEGHVVHRWSPCHRDIVKRSHVDKTILLVQIGDKYVPISDQGVQHLGSDVF